MKRLEPHSRFSRIRIKSGIPDRLEDKRMVLKLAFAEKLPYCRNDGFRTARYALPFALLEGLGQGNYEMVGLVGLEPTTKGL